MNNKGFLAIWCEIGEADLEFYRNWIIREHIADRTLLPGWLGARFCTDIHNERAHFFLYATADKDVFSARPYLDVLNTPSEWTRHIMPKFGPFDRALGEQLFKIGNGYGGWMMVARIREDEPLDIDKARSGLARFMELHDVVSVRLMQLDRSRTDIQSQEKTMRSGVEGDFDYLLVVEAISEAGGVAARQATSELLQKAFCGLIRFDASVRKVIYGETLFEAQTL